MPACVHQGEHVWVWSSPWASMYGGRDPEEGAIECAVAARYQVVNARRTDTARQKWWIFVTSAMYLCRRRMQLHRPGAVACACSSPLPPPAPAPRPQCCPVLPRMRPQSCGLTCTLSAG